MSRLATFLVTLFLLGASAPAAEEEKRPYVLYAETKIGFYVTLGDGTKWEVERTDAFPVVMFKEQQTKVILQLAGTTFSINTEWVTLIEEKAITPVHRASYQRHVDKYLERQSAEGKARTGTGN